MYTKSFAGPLLCVCCTPLFDAEYLRNGTRYRQNYNGIHTQAPILKYVISNDLEWPWRYNWLLRNLTRTNCVAKDSFEPILGATGAGAAGGYRPKCSLAVFFSVREYEKMSFSTSISHYFENDTRYGGHSYNGIWTGMRSIYRMVPFPMTLSDP